MELTMASWQLRLKGQQILRLGKGAENPHQLHLRSGISYPTVRKYIDEPGSVRAYDANVLPGILIEGQGLSPDEFLSLRIGDIFELVLKEEAE